MTKPKSSKVVGHSHKKATKPKKEELQESPPPSLYARMISAGMLRIRPQAVEGWLITTEDGKLTVEVMVAINLLEHRFQLKDDRARDFLIAVGDPYIDGVLAAERGLGHEAAVMPPTSDS